MVDSLLLRYISTVTVFLAGGIGSIGPIFVTAPSWCARLESLAGGVFLGASLAHLLAEAMETISHGLEEAHLHVHYPIGPAVTVLTFVILTVVELFSYSEHDAHAFDGEHEGHEHHHHHQQDALKDPLVASDVSALQTTDGEEKHHWKTVEFGDSTKNLTTATISLYIIMVIHSVIEGLALGSVTSLSSIVALWCAVLGHKPVEGFALGLILLKDTPPKWLFFTLMTIYALSSPLLTLVGIWLGNVEGDLIIGIIEAFSAGTFLFVGCHEWAEMFEHKHTWSTKEKLWHFFMFLAGVAWMLLVGLIPHDHGDHDHH